jgi:FkbM family methyltransferase
MVKRRKAAAALGISFKRCANFQLPQKMHINGQLQDLYVPNEHGVKVAFIDILLDDCYRCRKLARSCQPIGTVLDIGANVGLFGITARYAFPIAQIHAYEPNPYLEGYLAVQASSGNFSYFMEAVGLETGTISLQFHSDAVLTRTKVDTAGKIPQVAFKMAIERLGGSVDLVKMDCEGAEWDVFKDKDSWNRVKHLSMEYHLWPDHSHEEVLDVVQSLGFAVREYMPVDNFGLLIASRP